MRRETAVARRYARALAGLAREAQRLEDGARELAAFEGLLAEEPGLRDVLFRPWVPAATKRRLVATLAGAMGLSGLTRNFLMLLAQRRRMPLLPAIAAAYRELVDEALGQVRARLRSAAPLAEAERAALQGALGRKLGKTVLLETEVDATLLGGFIAEVGSQVWDASLTGELSALREQIIQGARGTA